MEVRPQDAREGVLFSWTGCFRAAVLAASNGSVQDVLLCLGQLRAGRSLFLCWVV